MRHGRVLRGVVVLLLTLVASLATAQAPALDENERRELGAPAGVELSGELLETRALEIGSLLRCPVCQGLSVADSPVPAALAMQARVERLVGAGYSEEQILAYFETAYGEFIRLSPKPEGFNLVVWILPVFAILVGIALVAWRVRSPTIPAPEGDLEEYRRRVREAVKGP